MKKTHLLLIVILLVLVGVLLSLMNDVSSYEAFNSEKAKAGFEVHVVGTLAKGNPIYYEPEKNANYFTFFMEDSNGEVRKVIYNQPKPQDFERSEKIVVVGMMNNNAFEASQILMKCPSKYVEEPKINS
jgi:cytochrome c-type biogenesis protein CcmE